MKDNKTVCIKLRFWTNGVEVVHNGKKSVVCWDSGVAIIEQNKTKGIGPLGPQNFNCYEDIIPLIKEMLRKNKILVISDSGRPRVLSHKRKSK
jgi:hypothetical protein